MTQIKKQVKNMGFHPLAAGVAGALVGGSIGVAASVALSRKKTRHMVGKQLRILKDQALTVLEDIDFEVVPNTNGKQTPAKRLTGKKAHKKTKIRN